jgi:hypothetical protein
MICPLLFYHQALLSINASFTLGHHLDTSQSLLCDWALLDIHSLELCIKDIPVGSLIPVPGLIAVPGGTMPAI